MKSIMFPVKGLTDQQVQDALNVMVDRGAQPCIGVSNTMRTHDFYTHFPLHDYQYAGVDIDGDTVISRHPSSFGHVVEITNFDKLMNQ